MRNHRRPTRHNAPEPTGSDSPGAIAVLERKGWIDPVAHELRPNEPSKPALPDGTTPLERDQRPIERTHPVRQHR